MPDLFAGPAWLFAMSPRLKDVRVSTEAGGLFGKIEIRRMAEH